MKNNPTQAQYFKKELEKLRQDAPIFAKNQPQLAANLNNISHDPDVERLLEGTAFLTAGIQQKLDDQYPEFLHQIASAIAPEALHPMPASTLIQFYSKKGNSDLIHVKKGTSVASEEYKDKSYSFSTCFPVDVWPIEVTAVDRGSYGDNEEVSGGGKIRIQFNTLDIPLNTLEMKKIRFYLGGDYAGGCDLLFILNQYLKAIKINSGTDNEVNIPLDCLTSVGFSDEETLIENKGNDLSVFNHIHDFFHLPEKFLFCDLDISSWTNRTGQSFDISFILKSLPIPVPSLTKSRFSIHVSPAINLYDKDAAPIILDHTQSDYPISIKDGDNDTIIFSVESVRGIRSSVKDKRSYENFSDSLKSGKNGAIYNLKPSTSSSKLSFVPTYSKKSVLENGEIIQMKLKVTDGDAAQELQPGQITQHTMQSPQRLNFTNLIVPKGARLAPQNEHLLWHLVSHSMLQKASLTSAESIKQYLSHYACLTSMTNLGANLAQRKIDGLVDLKVKSSDRLFKGDLYRGYSVTIKVRNDCFASAGDRYLFGTLINRLYQSLAPINYYSALVMYDLEQEESIEWPICLGKQILI